MCGGAIREYQIVTYTPVGSVFSFDVTAAVVITDLFRFTIDMGLLSDT